MASAARGRTDAVKRLQTGINRLNGEEGARQPKSAKTLRDPYKAADDANNLAPGGVPGADKPLKVDGVLGHKTAASTRRALARHGGNAVETAFQTARDDEETPVFSAPIDGGGVSSRRPRDGFGDPALLA